MEAGLLTERIALQKPTENKSTTGMPTITYSTQATIWAELLKVGGKEFYAAQKVVPQVSAVFRVRDVTVQTKWRVAHDKNYHIEYVVPDENELLLYCLEVV